MLSVYQPFRNFNDMENLDEAAYTQSDDRCIPPSISVLKSSTHDEHLKYNSNNENSECDNNEVKDRKNDERSLKDVNFDSKSKKTPEDDFRLSVENLDKIRKNREIMTETVIQSNDPTIASLDVQMRTSSPTVKLEVKKESSVITDALNSVPNDENTNRFNIKDSNVKKESRDMDSKIKSEKDQHSFIDSNRTKVNTTKSEFSHKSEKEIRNKTSKDHR